MRRLLGVVGVALLLLLSLGTSANAVPTFSGVNSFLPGSAGFFDPFIPFAPGSAFGAGTFGLGFSGNTNSAAAVNGFYGIPNLNGGGTVTGELPGGSSFGGAARVGVAGQTGVDQIAFGFQTSFFTPVQVWAVLVDANAPGGQSTVVQAGTAVSGTDFNGTFSLTDPLGAYQLGFVVWDTPPGAVHNVQFTANIIQTPEIDPATGTAPVALAVGMLLLLADRRRKALV